MRIPQLGIHAETEGRELLHDAGDGEIRTKLTCILHITAAASLQITGVHRSIDRRDIQDDKFFRRSTTLGAGRETTSIDAMTRPNMPIVVIHEITQRVV